MRADRDIYVMLFKRDDGTTEAVRAYIRGEDAEMDRAWLQRFASGTLHIEVVTLFSHSVKEKAL